VDRCTHSLSSGRLKQQPGKGKSLYNIKITNRIISRPDKKCGKEAASTTWFGVTIWY
jgi:hypothetical protein